MAINKKRSRKIIIENEEFCWRATGSDDSITVIIWPVVNDSSRLVGSIDYHHNWVETKEGHHSSTSQLIVTNRIIKEIILHFGVQEIIKNYGQLNIGKIENIYNVENAVRA